MQMATGQLASALWSFTWNKTTDMKESVPSKRRGKGKPERCLHKALPFQRRLAPTLPWYSTTLYTLPYQTLISVLQVMQIHFLEGGCLLGMPSPVVPSGTPKRCLPSRKWICITCNTGDGILQGCPMGFWVLHRQKTGDDQIQDFYCRFKAYTLKLYFVLFYSISWCYSSGTRSA